ncbi:MAG: leucine-rich repeat protein [Clostridia bacterium]|nr:leucine-rich repeat protein [Clostridia bacterium]
MRKLASLLLLLLLPCLALAEEADTALWDYTLTDEGAVITEYYRTEISPEMLVIPAELDGHPVVGIAEGAFTVLMSEISFAGDLPHLTNEDGFLIDTRTDTLLYTAPSSRGKALPAVRRLGAWSLCNWLEWDMDVVIPEGVEEIGKSAFYDVGLASLTLPESLRIIETNAFHTFGIESNEIILPAGVKEVQFGAFGIFYIDADPTGQTYWHLTVTPTDKWRTRFETYFEYAARTGDDWDMADYTLELYEYEETAEGLVITNVRWHAYGDALPDVIELPAEIWGEPVVGIADNALNTSESLSRDQRFTLVIPEGIKWLSDDAFWCCHHADTISFPASLTEIPEGCFDHVHAEIQVAAANPRYEMRDGFLIDQATDTLVFTTPACQGKPIPAVRRLGGGSMENYAVEWGEDLVIPEGVEEIGAYAFFDWEYGHVTLPESLRLIESMAFDVGITEPVVIPAGVETVQCCAFSGCGSVIEVTAVSESTRFETEAEHDARYGEVFWLHDWE